MVVYVEEVSCTFDEVDGVLNWFNVTFCWFIGEWEEKLVIERVSFTFKEYLFKEPTDANGFGGLGVVVSEGWLEMFEVCGELNVVESGFTR